MIELNVLAGRPHFPAIRHTSVIHLHWPFLIYQPVNAAPTVVLAIMAPGQDIMRTAWWHTFTEFTPIIRIDSTRRQFATDSRRPRFRNSTDILEMVGELTFSLTKQIASKSDELRRLNNLVSDMQVLHLLLNNATLKLLLWYSAVMLNLETVPCFETFLRQIFVSWSFSCQTD